METESNIKIFATKRDLKEAGWKPLQVKALGKLKHRYRQGEMSEDFSLRELRGLEFTRWLTEHDRLTEESPSATQATEQQEPVQELRNRSIPA